MKKTVKTTSKNVGFAAVLIVLFFFSATVFAAGTSTQGASGQNQNMSSDQQKQDDQQSMNQNPGIKGNQQTKMGMQGKSMNTMFKASDLIDKNVTNSQNAELGEIKDLMVNRDGQIEYLIISHGGTLGIGEDLVAVPWSAAQAHIQGDKLAVNISKEKLDQAPTFKNDDWTGFFSPQHQEEVRGYYGNPQTGREGTPAGTRTGLGGKQNQD